MNYPTTNGSVRSRAIYRTLRNYPIKFLIFIKKYGLETPSFRLVRKIRPRVLDQGVSLKKTLGRKHQKML